MRPMRRSQSEFVQPGTLGAGRHPNQPHDREEVATSPIGKYGRHFAVASSKRTPGDTSVSSSTSTPHVIALVGLPARGKTYISKKLSRYLNWIGVETKVINLGDYRRKYTNYANHNIFNNDNPEGLRIRNQVCEEGLQDAINYLENEGGEAVVFDATNTTRERRRLLHDTVVKKKGFKLFFVESVCDDETIIDSNIRSVKVTSPDYISFNADQVVEDFKERIKHYEAQYQTLDEELESELSFMKIFNAGEKVLVHKHEGHVESRIVYYLMNIKITPRTIYLTRHGESNYNLQQKLGGDPGLSPRGKDYAQKLGEYMNSLSIPNLLVWTSFMRRTHQTAKHVVGIHERWKTLNELDVGVCDGLTYEEVKGKYPDDFIARDKNKYRYRYPRGESYEDLVARLEPVIMELERHGSVLVVGHQAILRCILAYFEEIDEDELPYLEVPLHTIIKLEPRAYGCHVEFERLNVDCVSTHRPKPKVPGQLQDDIATQLDQIEIHHV
ncbi:6-phosphofructo-2-kinase/fructose-2,6-bisphosphatase 1-like [Tigriopus californicus]|uniref:6-phosphofructo-2-kinase/fructose-2, 6-bisphosphatase 1-like n=1 Tax=Tigriopus californicus TaxID=6832 RepID=UPI0027DA0A84|nr:6-phosphofructo-2-kinase/fructose-2,6-bisphosphatase 1-like [Tigriopus californicus]